MFLIHKQTCVTENVNIITESEYHAANQVEEPAAAEEVKIIETSNNHVVAESNGDIIGHIPKKILEGFIDVCDVSPAPIRYIFII